MINWIYQWYKPEGNLQANNLVPQFTDMVFGGILAVTVTSRHQKIQPSAGI